MPTLAIVKASNANFNPSYVPVAVFVGGTSGVGQGMLEAFARYVKGRAHIIVVGRNEYAAADIIARLPKPAEGEAEGWKHEFLACDVSLMANVRAACADIRARVTRVNFLVMTAAYSSMVNTAVTTEGLDLLLAMR
jgi:NAD(P)-dependent dehydrogenase (short-subunit alcohol dehydrogenase family)